MPQAKYAKKERLTVSLSHDTVRYLESGRAHAQAPSLSAQLENLLRDLQARTEMEQVEAKMSAYYDSLSAGEIEEQADWGRVGAASLAQLED
jgi:hypothetical protein